MSPDLGFLSVTVLKTRLIFTSSRRSLHFCHFLYFLLRKQYAKSKEIRELKRGLQGDSWEFVLSRIEDIEKELDLMLTFLQVEEDKKA